jgi:hypothetical protein
MRFFYYHARAVEDAPASPHVLGKGQEMGSEGEHPGSLRGPIPYPASCWITSVPKLSRYSIRAERASGKLWN